LHCRLLRGLGKEPLPRSPSSLQACFVAGCSSSVPAYLAADFNRSDARSSDRNLRWSFVSQLFRSSAGSCYGYCCWCFRRRSLTSSYRSFHGNFRRSFQNSFQTSFPRSPAESHWRLANGDWRPARETYPVSVSNFASPWRPGVPSTARGFATVEMSGASLVVNSALLRLPQIVSLCLGGEIRLPDNVAPEADGGASSPSCGCAWPRLRSRRG
jgi:hypothetical protein